MLLLFFSYFIVCFCTHLFYIMCALDMLLIKATYLLTYLLCVYYSPLLI